MGQIHTSFLLNRFATSSGITAHFSPFRKYSRNSILSAVRLGFASGGNAVSVMVSQNLGAGNHDRVKKSLFWDMLLNWAVCIAVSFLMFFGSDPALRVFLGSSDATALDYGNSYIRLISIFYIFCFTGSAYMGYFKGRGHMVIAFCGTTMHIIFRAVCSAIMIGKMGLTAVALFSGLGWMLCVTFLTINFVRIQLTDI